MERREERRRTRKAEKRERDKNSEGLFSLDPESASVVGVNLSDL
jgi:hypothetical protein